MRWAGYVARTKEKRVTYYILVGRPDGKNQVKHLNADKRILLK
jgi:hypothetical protein